MAARRLAIALIVAAGLIAVPSVTLAASPSPSPSASGCFAPSGNAGTFGGSVGCSLVNSAISAAAQALPGGGAAASLVLAPYTQWVADGAAWVVEQVTQLVVGTSTTPSLGPTQADLYGQVYGRVLGIALSLSLLLALIGVIEATLAQRPGGYRRVLVGIAAAGIVVGALPEATALLVRITDDLSSGIAANQSAQVAQGLKGIVQVLKQDDSQLGNAAFDVAAIGLIVGGILLWAELLVRDALIYLWLAVAPLACAAVQWQRLEGVLRQVLFAGLALILSKLVIVIALAVGFAVLPMGAGLQSLVSGMFIIAVAALSPFATARVLPIAAEEMALSNQGRFRNWGLSAVGTAAQVVTAFRVGGGGGGALAGKGATSDLPIAPPMGRSDVPVRLTTAVGPGRPPELPATPGPVPRRLALAAPPTQGGPRIAASGPATPLPPAKQSPDQQEEGQ